MPSYMRDNFERFGNYLCIHIMYSSICNVKEFCYTSPVLENKIGNINAVYEGFVISKTHDVYILILESLYKMCPIKGEH